jgi:catechol 2,3-dioxygenase-like lactoylglutathione lyase family enzyme
MSALKASAVHHIGVSVSVLDEALRFWEAFLGRPATWRTMLNRPYLAEIIGIPGVKIDGAFIDLPGGVVLELLEYQNGDGRPNPSATANPGNVHICLAVENADAAWRRAIECGATPVRREGPVEVDDGPNQGARVAYLRIHDGVTLEVYQGAPASNEGRA